MLLQLSRAAAVAAILAAGGPAAAQQINSARLDSLLNTLSAKNKLMGSLAVSRAGQVVYSHGFGAAQLAPATPNTAATRFRVGSITKMFTATMIFQLIEERKLTLSTPLATFFPQLPNAPAITVEQLLSHRSGLHNFTADPAFGTYMTLPKTQAELLAIMAQPKPDFAPGAKYAYSNTNYELLGFIVEKLTKIPYAQALQKRVVARAKLANTYYGGPLAAQPLEAHSYASDGHGGWKPGPESDMSIPGGAGAVVSTPTDLDHFLEALFGSRLVSAASLAEMRNLRDGYGHGLMLLPFGTRQSFGHGGVIDNFVSFASYFPDEQLAVSLCTNGQQYSTNEAMKGVLSICFNQPYKIPDFAASGFVPTPADLDRYAGTYATPKLPLKVTMSRDGTALRSQATGQGAFNLEPVSAGVFKFEPAGIRVVFAADAPTFTLEQGGATFVFTKE